MIFDEDWCPSFVISSLTRQIPVGATVHGRPLDELRSFATGGIARINHLPFDDFLESALAVDSPLFLNLRDESMCLPLSTGRPTPTLTSRGC